MKKHLKKLFITLLVAFSTLCLAVGLSACEDKGNTDGNEDTVLATPQLTISGNVLSWAAVENADHYEVYENSQWVVDTTETSYTITQEVVGTYVYEVKAVSENDKFTDSAKSNKQTYIVTEKSQPLDAPVISIAERTGTDEDNATYTYYEVSWEAVPNADGYHLFENGGSAISVSGTSYAITQKQKAGDYSYQVKAVSANKKFTESALSNTAVFTVKELDAPTNLKVDNENAILSWDAVEDASLYSIYVNGSFIGSVQGTSYEMTQEPGNKEYTVAASTELVEYTQLGKMSAALSYDVPLIVVTRFNVPTEDFTASGVKVGLYQGSTATIEKEVTDFNSTVRIVAPVGEYTVKLTGLPQGYVSSWTTINADNQRSGAAVTVLEMTEDNTMTEGEHQEYVVFTNGNGDGVYEEVKEYLFIAGATADGYYTVTTEDLTESYPERSLKIYVNGSKIIDTTTTPAFLLNSFQAEEGEPVVLTVEYTFVAPEDAGDDSVLAANFNFEIKAGETKQYLNVLSKPYDPDAIVGEPTYNEQMEQVNFITGTCTRYIKLDETKKLTFMFFSATVGARTITLKIDGKEYELNSGLLSEEYQDFDEFGFPVFKTRIVYLEFEVGVEYAIEINVTGSGFAGQDVMTFHVYPEA